MSDAVPVELENLNSRDGLILEIRIDCKGDAESKTLLVEILLESIMCISLSNVFLRRVEITQESRSGDGRQI